MEDSSSDQKCTLPFCVATELCWAVLTSKEVQYDLLLHLIKRWIVIKSVTKQSTLVLK